MDDEYDYLYEHKYSKENITKIREKEINKYKLITDLCNTLIEYIESNLPLSNTIIINEEIICLGAYTKMYEKSMLGNEIAMMATKILFDDFN